MRKITKRIMQLTHEYEELEYESYKHQPLYVFVWLFALIFVIILVARNSDMRVDSLGSIIVWVFIGTIPLILYYYYLYSSRKSIRCKLRRIMEYNKQKPDLRVELKTYMIDYQRRINHILGYSLQWD